MLDPDEKHALVWVIKEWLKWEMDMRSRVHRPWAVMGGEVTTQDVVFHDPDAMR